MNDGTTPPYRAEACALEMAPAFDAAVIQLAADLAAFYQAQPDAAAMFADVGQLAIVSGLLALPTPVTEADLCRLVGAGALASRRRVRNHIARLEGAGLAQLGDGGDRRTRPMVSTPKLDDLLNQWVRALASAAADLCGVDKAMLERGDLARFYLRQVIAAAGGGWLEFSRPSRSDGAAASDGAYCALRQQHLPRSQYRHHPEHARSRPPPLL